MINLFQRALVAALTLCALVLTSCGDDVRFDDSQTGKFEQSIFISPEGGFSNIFLTTWNEAYISISDHIKIQAIFRLNDEVLDADIAASYYQSILWIIDGKKINIPNFRHTFLEPGQYDCILQTVTNFGDTLTDTTHIFVDTPSSISLAAPRNGYNQIDPFSEQEIPLQWNATGIDPWEMALCEIFCSDDPDELWESHKKTVHCDGKFSIKGPFLPNEDVLKEQNIDPSSNSIKFYWGVIMTVMNAYGIQKQDTSDIFKFSTKLINTDSSILNIPISYKYFHNNVMPDTRITIVSAQGDTLDQINSASISTVESVKLAAQTGVKVYMEEAYFDEYKADSFTIDIPEQAEIDADSVYFEDKTPPTIWPQKKEYMQDSPILFSVLDKGSGIALSKIDIHLDDASNVVYTYTEPLLEVVVPIKKPVRLYIRISDNAGNQSAPVFWKVTPKNNLQILDGPYINAEALE